MVASCNVYVERVCPTEIHFLKLGFNTDRNLACFQGGQVLPGTDPVFFDPETSELVFENSVTHATFQI